VPNGSRLAYLNSHEVKITVIIPLFIFSLFNILFGFLGSDLFLGMGSNFFGNSLFIHPNNIFFIESEFSLSLIIKLLPVIFSLFGAILALLLYQQYPIFILDSTHNYIGKNVYTFLNGKYFFDIVYNNYIISKGLQLAYTISKQLDRGII
jgi:NADH-ubiquinone oxidoreductase chain 5